jgi:ribonuclease HIII
VAQRTLVLKLAAREGADLESRLAAAGFEFRAVPHAQFSARSSGVIVTLYRSGKLVVQGPDPEAFTARFLANHAAAQVVAVEPVGQAAASRTQAVVTVGTDESGKGDYFGPLVVAGVRLTPELASKLAGGEVRDCKLMSDASVLRVGGALRRVVPFAIRRLDPPAYNATHARLGNLNPLLAGLHAEVIGELAVPGMRVVVDQFADERVLRKALGGLAVDLRQKTRAESSEISVAAASVLAREEFLTALGELSQTWGVELAKGAGSPTDRAGRQFIALHGADKLGAVAKLHFRTTHKIGGGVAR